MELRQKNKSIEVRANNSFGYVIPDEFDIKCLEAQMQGVVRAFDPKTDDYRVKSYLEKALTGETYRKPPHDWRPDRWWRNPFGKNGRNGSKEE